MQDNNVDFHFIAIGGVGQSALAKILLQLGYKVSGSDIQDGKYMIYTESSQNKVVEYHAKGASDFRLKYTDASGSRYSPIYNTTLDGTTIITSMWMNANDATASLIISPTLSYSVRFTEAK